MDGQGRGGLKLIKVKVHPLTVATVLALEGAIASVKLRGPQICNLLKVKRTEIIYS